MNLDATTITAVSTAIVLVLGSVFSGIILIIKATRTEAKVDAGNTKADASLGRIEVLVDGRYSDVLQELANVKAILAETSGSKEHIKEAMHAQVKADEQALRVEASRIIPQDQAPPSSAKN